MEFYKVLPNDPPIVMFAKIAVNQGRSPGLEKDAFYDAIVKRADDLRADGESHQQAFAKTITGDQIVRILYQAMKIAPGSEVKPVPQEPAKGPESLGPAHAQMHSAAIDLQRRNPRLSYEAAYSRVYTDPSLAGLREKVRNEHLASSMAVAVNG